ncbi:MAG: zinc ribbon domain-containing protein [Oscillospiraceae bacterium]|nr:zinc ribbon domain-containing protein [Oscillospiraceae bacterium]
MKSIKPGRYNSGQSVLGAVFGIIFVIFWTVSAVRMGAPVIFPVFGVGMLIMLITELVKSWHNATSKNRYSEFDIVDSREEPDPWEEKFTGEIPLSQDVAEEVMYCPYCGAKLAPDFEYCPKCGRKLPY